MRAFAVVEPFKSEVRQVAVPEPGPGEALIKVAYCGICGTDYHIYKGEFLSPYPLILGHEFSGTIEALGPGVRGWQVGERVTVDPSLFCGECYYCLNKQWNHCANWGALGNTVDGAFAEYVKVPARNLYRIPDRLSMEEAAFVEPLACVVWGLERVRVMPGARVLIFGAGPIGCLMLQGMAANCAADVVVVDVAEEKLAIARELGATATYVSGADLKQQLMERTQGRGFDVVVDVTGVPAVIENMFQYAAKRAKILQFGVAPADARVQVSPFAIYHNDWEIYGSMAVNYTMQPALDLLTSGRVRVKPLLTRIAALEELGSILAVPKPAGDMKVLIKP